MNDDNYRCEKNKEKVDVAVVSAEDIRMIKKVHKILDAGKNVEIKRDSNGKPKILKVSKELV